MNSHATSSSTYQFHTRHFTCVWLINVHTWLSYPFYKITCETTRSVAPPAQTHVFSDTTCNFPHVLHWFLLVVGSCVLMWNHQGVVRGWKCPTLVYIRVFSSPWSQVKPHDHTCILFEHCLVFRHGKRFHMCLIDVPMRYSFINDHTWDHLITCFNIASRVIMYFKLSSTCGTI